MKNNRSHLTYTAFFLVVCCLIMGAGCATPPAALMTPQVQEITRTNTVVEYQVKTNLVILTNTTSSEPVFVTSTVPILVTNTILQTQTVTNWAPAQTAEAAASVANVAFPGAGAAIMGGLSLWAAWLNRKNKSLAESTVAGIEEFRNDLKASAPDLDAKLVDKLKKAHKLAGLAEMAAKTVNKVTR